MEHKVLLRLKRQPSGGGVRRAKQAIRGPPAGVESSRQRLYKTKSLTQILFFTYIGTYPALSDLMMQVFTLGFALAKICNDAFVIARFVEDSCFSLFSITVTCT